MYNTSKIIVIIIYLKFLFYKAIVYNFHIRILEYQHLIPVFRPQNKLCEFTTRNTDLKGYCTLKLALNVSYKAI